MDQSDAVMSKNPKTDYAPVSGAGGAKYQCQVSRGLDSQCLDLARAWIPHAITKLNRPGLIRSIDA
eukprot:8304261-Pyramimonas_sp.AAC.1